MDDAWYAGNIDRSIAEQKLLPLADGSFLVRASRTRRGFTLTVKFLEVRHIVIVESQGKFGFSEPTTFPTVADLVRHFQNVSLAYYNAELETTLRYPYKTAPLAGQDDVTYDDALDNDDIYVSNVYALRERLARQHRDFRHERAAPAVQSYEEPPNLVDKEGIAHLDKVGLGAVCVCACVRVCVRVCACACVQRGKCLHLVRLVVLEVLRDASCVVA